jgi:hypothetical protein
MSSMPHAGQRSLVVMVVGLTSAMPS